MKLNQLINVNNMVFESVVDKINYTKLLEAESNNPTPATSELLEKLYDSLLKKSNIDYDTIPNSKGDVEKYHGYDTMREALRNINDLSQKQLGKNIDEADVINMALDNIVALKQLYTRGFSLDKDFVILQYNSLVAACVTATSAVLRGYVDYLRSPDGDITIIPSKSVLDGNLLISNLRLFNKSVVSGEYHNTLNTIINTKVKESYNPLKEEFWILPIAIVGGTILLISVLRALVFYFYYARTRLSEELALQSKFLELNTANVSNKNLPASEKKKIIERQKAMSKTLASLSDKLRVNEKKAQETAVKELKKDDAKWTLDTDTNASATQSSGYQMI